MFDAHFHLIDPKFPLIKNNGFLPEPFTIEDYKQSIKGLPFVGGAVVAGSFQHGYQAFLVRALEELGKNFVGVTTYVSPMTDKEFIALDNQGIRAIRFNLYRGEEQALAPLITLAKSLYDLIGWHVELYVSNKSLGVLIPVIEQMPKVCIDYLHS